MKSTWVRISLLAFMAVAALTLLPGTSTAQQAPADLPPEKAKQFLELISDPDVKAWLESRSAAAPTPEEQPGGSAADAISDWEAAVHDRLGALANAIPRVPEEVAAAAAVVSRDVNAGRPGLVIGILAVLIIVGSGAEWLIRRGLQRVSKLASAVDIGQPTLVEVAALTTFALASIGSFLIFEWPPLLRKIVLTLLLALIVVRIVRAVVKLLFVVNAAGSVSADGPAAAAIDMDAARSFWLKRVTFIAGFLLFGWAIVSLMPVLGFSIDVMRLVALTFGLGMLATAVEIVWRRPRSTIMKLLLTLTLVVLWLAWVAGLLGLLWVGLYALLLPTVVRGAGDLAQTLANKAKRGGAVGVMLNVLAVRGARAVVIALAVAWLAYIWRIRAASFADSETGAFVISGLLNGVIILLVADLFWQLSKALIAYRMDLAAPEGADPHDVARSSRLRTLLPIFRNALAAFIGAVAVLSILAGMGVQIAPLIAGAGIFGVAIGFGSQTLVKDVLSGVFYMLDDAFRVGEYIQSGSYKGTVESFSLRSVRLRHHRGPVFTVPFGQLGAVQNMSRDWAIDKIMIGVTYDFDIDLARKLVKKIGLELAADPEFAADTLQPLKMQGIENFGDYAIELKMKLMTKPGTAFGIKRRALLMIKKAFAENGIKIAVPTVHVEGGSDNAAAAQQVIKIKQAAEVAASQAANSA